MSTVAIKKDVLTWALDRARFTTDQLQRKFPNIPKWISGESQPTLRQLESFAKATSTPLGFLFLEEPPRESLPLPHYRTVREDERIKPSPDLIDTIQLMQRRQLWMRQYLIEQGEERLPFVGSSKIEEKPGLIAERIRSVLGFNKGWAARSHNWTAALNALREAIDKVGILVVVNGIVENNTHRKLDPSEFRGFVLVDEYTPLVFVNGADGKAAQMFTLAHEIAHVLLGSSAAFDLRGLQPADNEIERACNKIAAEFLVPEDEMRKAWSSLRDKTNRFQSLASQFKVSEIVVARRALDLVLIDKRVFFEFYNLYQNEIRRAAESQPTGGDFYANQNYRIGSRFGSTVISAVREGSLLYSEAYKLTSLYGRTFEQYSSSLGFGE